MTTNLTIKDLSIDRELGAADLAKVRGGLGNQSNATQQGNFQSMFAPVAVANGASFGGCGPVSIQVDSSPTQSASNYSGSDNAQGGAVFPLGLDDVLGGSRVKF